MNNKKHGEGTMNYVGGRKYTGKFYKDKPLKAEKMSSSKS